MKNLPLDKKIIWGAVAFLAVVNAAQTATRLADIYPRKKPVAFVFAGKKFEGLDQLFKNEKYVGYYTDRDINSPGSAMELLQAQNMVVPLILDPGNIEHRYIVVNCSNIPAAIEKFKALGAKPLSHNNLGIFLVERQGL